MRLYGALFAIVGLAFFSQGCGDSSGSDPGDESGGNASGAKAGRGGGGATSGAGAPGLGGATGITAGTGAGASSGAPGAAGNGSANGGAGGASFGGVSSGGTSAAGTSAAGNASGGTAGKAGASGGTAGKAGASGGSAGSAQGGSGGLNNDGPCPVPSYIASDPKPIGWASEGTATTGGGTATPILVTTLAELKTEVSGSTAKVIYVKGEFAPASVSIGSNKTIIGCSAGAKVQGHLGIGSGSSNVILRNLSVSGYGVGDCTKDPGFDPGTGCSSGDDAISVNGSAHHVWVDHCLIMDGTDGNLDITNNADFVTVSWTKFAYTPRTDNVGDDSTGAAGHRFSNLVGGTDSTPTG
ncbi:MAG TPA: hypothetical protein VGJ91_17940, partial [Polyangiaceae bacterium]